MKIYELNCEQLIPKPLSEVFSFFENPENLALITPPSLGFKILTPSPILMKHGLKIDYTIRLLGMPVRWTSVISDYQPPASFVDRQERGPYAHWHHTHRFRESPEGTLVIDEVRYAIPLGFLGELAHLLFVKRELKRIFDFRAHVIRKFFNF